VHGDVFRPPQLPQLLSVYVATGIQLLLMALLSLVLAALGFFSPAHRGSLLGGSVVLFLLSGSASGFVAARFSKLFNEENKVRVTLLTAMVYPGVCAAIFFGLNILIWAHQSSGAVPIGTLVRPARPRRVKPHPPPARDAPRAQRAGGGRRAAGAVCADGDVVLHLGAARLPRRIPRLPPAGDGGAMPHEPHPAGGARAGLVPPRAALVPHRGAPALRRRLRRALLHPLLHLAGISRPRPAPPALPHPAPVPCCPHGPRRTNNRRPTPRVQHRFYYMFGFLMVCPRPHRAARAWRRRVTARAGAGGRSCSSSSS